MSEPVQRPVPLVSIAMATYNGALYLAEQIESILSQSITDFELIISDDASSDATCELIKKYIEKDNRVRGFFNRENKGYRDTFYASLSHCRAEFILFCDQDDVWLSNKIETLLGIAEDNLLVFSDSALVDEDGRQMGIKLSDTVHMRQPGTNEVNRGFVIGNCVWGHTILFHRSLLHYTAHAENNHPHDWWFAVVSSHLHKIRYCPMVLNHYRQHAGNLTHTIKRKGVTPGKKPARKMEEYLTQLSRIASIKELSFNRDKAFYEKWYALFQERKKGFPFSLFRFLFIHQEDIFSFKKKNLMSRLIGIWKMCRKVS